MSKIAVVTETTEKNIKGIIDRFLYAMMEGEHARCASLIKEFREIDRSPIALYEQVFKPALYQVGTLWEENLISVATEHLATALVEALMNEQYDYITPEKRNSHILVAAAVENETHQVGIKMVADTFEMHGWDTRFLGANIPTEELLRYAERVKPDLLALSLSVYFHVPKLEEMLRRIAAAFPEVPVVVGGQAFLRGGREVLARFPNVTHLSDLPAVERYITSVWGEQ